MIPTWLIRYGLPVIGAGIALWALVSWHSNKIEAVQIAAMEQQAALSAADFAAAYEAAQQQQQAEIAAQVEDARAINKEQVNALEARNDRIGRDYAALRLRWRQAQAQAYSGGAGDGRATAVPADASGDPFAAAKAAGWVDFDAAATLAEAADRATAKHDAAVGWWLKQCRAWRGPKLEDCQ